MKFIKYTTAIALTVLPNLTTARLSTKSDITAINQEQHRQLQISLQSCDNDEGCPIGQHCGDVHEILQLRLCEDIPLLSAGSDCTDNVQCDSGYCFNNICPNLCQSTTDCTADERCEVVEATAQGEVALCVPLSPPGSPCNDDDDCLSGFCFAQSTCMIPLGGSCTASTDCITGRCVNEPNGICEVQAEEGEECRTSDDCMSGQCLNRECVVECTTNNQCRTDKECLHIENRGDFCLNPDEYQYDNTDPTNSKIWLPNTGTPGRGGTGTGGGTGGGIIRRNTAAPTISVSPSMKPSASVVPSSTPTETAQPSPVPTSPTGSPFPSPGPSQTPSFSVPPTMVPSSTPSGFPTNKASMMPSGTPSLIPSNLPSAIPSAMPSYSPSSFPSRMPTANPTPRPTGHPTPVPTRIIYEPCDICGGFGSVTFGEGIVEMDGQAPVRCDSLQQSGNDGLIDPAVCEYLPEFTSVCGCDSFVV